MGLILSPDSSSLGSVAMVERSLSRCPISSARALADLSEAHASARARWPSLMIRLLIRSDQEVSSSKLSLTNPNKFDACCVKGRTVGQRHLSFRASKRRIPKLAFTNELAFTTIAVQSIDDEANRSAGMAALLLYHGCVAIRLFVKSVRPKLEASERDQAQDRNST